MDLTITKLMAHSLVGIKCSLVRQNLIDPRHPLSKYYFSSSVMCNLKVTVHACILLSFTTSVCTFCCLPSLQLPSDSTAKASDKRVRLMNEIITGMQLIKMYTWEKPFHKVISAVRK